MRNFKIKGKAIIALTLTAVIALSGVGIYKAKAAGRVETDKAVKITAAIAANDTSIFATEYKGTVEIDLYKIAAMDETGSLVLDESLVNSGIQLSVLDGAPTVKQVKDAIVNPALTEIANMTPAATITLDRSTGAMNATEPIEKGAGLYLYNPKDAIDSRYTHTFTSYVIQVPTSEYLTKGTGDDEWIYKAEFTLKSESEERFGKLDITKTLDSFNTSLGTASFVYTVVATRDNETVFENVYSINFDVAGSITRTIEGIPADADVTVTEVYKGASYEAVGADSATAKIVADDTVTVNFENDYNDKLIVGGISAENVFENYDGKVYWIDKAGTKVKQ